MMLQSVLPLLPPAVIVAGMLLYGRARTFDRATLLLLLLALALYYFHFYHTSWHEFTLDPEPHMDYIRFLIEQHRLPLPTDNMGAAARHPPAFYLCSALLLHMAEISGLANPEQFARHLAIACYMVFVLMGVQLLRLLLAPPSMGYYGALLMLLFWPIGVTMGGRISCDILLFAGQMGTLYALIRWQQQTTPQRLCLPFIWSGIAVMGKNSGFIMIAFAGYALLRTAWIERRNLKTLLRADLTASILFALASAALSFWHGWILRHIEAYGYYWGYLWQMVSSFNPFLFIYDTNLGLSQESFWNMWLHTLLAGDGTMRWNYSSLILVSKVLWLVVIIYSFEGLTTARKLLSSHEKNALTLLTIFTVTMIVAALYLLMRTGNPNYMDARYAYPAMITFPLLFGLAMKHNQLAGRASAYRMGSVIGIAFAGVTAALFITQYWG